MATAADIVAQLRAHAKAGNLSGMARYGINVSNRLGVSIPELRRLAKAAGRDHRTALELWATGIAEAKIVASMIAVPAELTEEQMEAWVKDFDSWDVCDQVCMNLFSKSPLAQRKISDWAAREEEFVKRAAFALLACVAWNNRQATDEELRNFLPLVKQAATDERNYVKKAVNWALRNVGKRSLPLNQAAIAVARELAQLDSKAGRWVGKDALRELESAEVKRRLTG